MTANPWRLTPKQRDRLVLSGLEPEEVYTIEAERKRLYEDIMADPNYVDDKRHGYMQKYGIDHECHCLEDKFLDNYVRVTRCSSETAHKAFDALELTLIERDDLRETVRTLRRQIEKLGERPIA